MEALNIQELIENELASTIKQHELLSEEVKRLESELDEMYEVFKKQDDLLGELIRKF